MKNECQKTSRKCNANQKCDPKLATGEKIRGEIDNDTSSVKHAMLLQATALFTILAEKKCKFCNHKM
jgi:hypothetical protein